MPFNGSLLAERDVDPGVAIIVPGDRPLKTEIDQRRRIDDDLPWFDGEDCALANASRAQQDCDSHQHKLFHVSFDSIPASFRMVFENRIFSKPALFRRSLFPQRIPATRSGEEDSYLLTGEKSSWKERVN